MTNEQTKLATSTENEFRNIKLKLKGLQRNSEIQAVKALMAMSGQQGIASCQQLATKLPPQANESPKLVYGWKISMTEAEFKELAEKEGIVNVIGEPICKLCGELFSGPLGIALHSCPALEHQIFKCEYCGEDKWKTKANLHSHIKWCKRKVCAENS